MCVALRKQWEMFEMFGTTIHRTSTFIHFTFYFVNLPRRCSFFHCNERKVYWNSNKRVLVEVLQCKFQFQSIKGRNVNRLWRHTLWTDSVTEPMFKCFEFSQKNVSPEMKRFVRPLTLGIRNSFGKNLNLNK
jgi:hypothetical protein